MQHGLKGSSGRDDLNCWSSWYDSSRWERAAKGFLRWEVTARRDSGMQTTPLRVHKIGAILASRCTRTLSRSISGGAADGHAVGPLPRFAFAKPVGDSANP